MEDEETEFDEILLNLTEADLVAIDAASTGYKSSASASPLQKYRRSGVLSVTDLVAPAWYVYLH
jgi:hypothetical protein